MFLGLKDGEKFIFLVYKIFYMLGRTYQDIILIGYRLKKLCPSKGMVLTKEGWKWEINMVLSKHALGP